MDYQSLYYQQIFDLTNGYERITPNHIRQLRANQIFVFGTDRKGSQRLGAAGFAARCCGAEKNISEGLTGSSYALPTQGFTFKEIADAINRFVNYVRANKSKVFMVTPVGCGHAGQSPEKIAPLFLSCLALNNVWLPNDFIKIFRRIALESQKTSDCEHKDEGREDDVYSYYVPQVHEIIRLLIEKNIPFNKEGGFCLLDDNNVVIAEAELGIESLKIVILPFNSQSEKTLTYFGYEILTVEEAIKRIQDA